MKGIQAFILDVSLAARMKYAFCLFIAPLLFAGIAACGCHSGTTDTAVPDNHGAVDNDNAAQGTDTVNNTEEKVPENTQSLRIHLPSVPAEIPANEKDMIKPAVKSRYSSAGGKQKPSSLSEKSCSFEHK